MQRRSHPTRLIAAVVLAVVAAIGATATPATAEPDPSDERISELRVPKGDGATATAVVCYGHASPAPQYSSAGGPWGTVHYGGKLICTEVGELTMVVYLYSVHGSGDNERKDYEDSFARYNVGSSIGDSQPVACIGNGSTRWILAIYGQYNGLNFHPYPSWSSVKTLPCGSG